MLKRIKKALPKIRVTFSPYCKWRGQRVVFRLPEYDFDITLGQGVLNFLTKVTYPFGYRF